MTKRLLALILALLLTLPLAAALMEEAAQPEAAEEESHFFADMAFTYLDGTPFDTAAFRDTPILLNMWATWCSPCVGEMPHLDALAAEYAGRIHIIGVHSEGLTVTEQGELIVDEDKTAAALKLQEELGLTFPLLNPDSLLFILMNDPQYGINLNVLPTTWLIDGEGYIRSIVESAYDKAGWQRIIDRFLSDLVQEDVDEPDLG
ncbi:MAG: TlpA family protein disulfide reductase [Clostridiales bacterium]|nr:TlpA family protein disulfide reductase [Clostridiales bacterium]